MGQTALSGRAGAKAGEREKHIAYVNRKRKEINSMSLENRLRFGKRTTINREERQGYQRCIECYTLEPLIDLRQGTLEETTSRPVIVKYNRYTDDQGVDKVDPVYAPIRPRRSGLMCKRCLGDLRVTQPRITPGEYKIWNIDREIDRGQSQSHNPQRDQVDGALKPIRLFQRRIRN